MKRNLSHFFRIIVAMLGFSLLSQGAWADAPSVETFKSTSNPLEPTFVREATVLKDGTTRVKLFVLPPGEEGRGIHYRTELHYKSGKKVMYDLGVPTFPDFEQFSGRQSVWSDAWNRLSKHNERFRRAEIVIPYDYQQMPWAETAEPQGQFRISGATKRIVETPNKDGTVTQRTYVKEGQTGVHDRKTGKKIAGGWSEVPKWVRTEVIYFAGSGEAKRETSRVGYQRAYFVGGRSENDHLRNLTVTRYHGEEVRRGARVQPRISVSRCQAECGNRHRGRGEMYAPR